MEHPVLPLEVERQGQRLPDPGIAEHLAFQIERQRSLLADGFADPAGVLQQPARPQRREVVRRVPVAHVRFPKDVEQTLAKRLAGDRGIPVHVVTDRAEVVAPPIDREIAAPIVVDPLVGDVVPVEFGNPVRSADKRRLKRDLSGVPVRVVVRRSHGEGGQRQQVRMGEHIPVVDDELPCVHDLDRLDPGSQVELPGKRCGVHTVVGEAHVGGRHRCPVMPASRLVQSDVEGLPVGR